MKSGDVVMLRRGSKRKAKIAKFLPDVKGGVVLDAYLGGCLYWNVKDLRVVKYARRSA